MNEIENILKNKEKSIFTFYILSPDNKQQIKTKNLQDFADEWLEGDFKNGNFENGTMISSVGFIITPADKNTEIAVKEIIRSSQTYNSEEIDLTSKKEKEFKFIVLSPDEENIIHTNNLQKFADEWLNGEFQEDKMINSFGAVIYPKDEYTKEAVREKIRIEENKKLLKITQELSIISKATTGLENDDLSKLIIIQNNKKSNNFIDTDKGRVFIIDKNNDNYNNIVYQDDYLKKIGINEGSMSLDNVIVMKDSINDLTIVIDTKKEVLSVNDLTNRTLTKNKTLNVNENYMDDLNNNHLLLNVDIYADDSTINSIKRNINHIQNICEHTGQGVIISEAGFNHSIISPISQSELNKVTKKFPIIEIDTNIPIEDMELFKNTDGITKKINAILITKDFISAAGFKDDVLFFENNNSFKNGITTFEANEGMYLVKKFENGSLTPIFDIITQKEIQENNFKLSEKKQRNLRK